MAGRVTPIFTEGRLSLPLIEASVARALGLQDGQVVQALVQVRGDQMGLLLRGRLIDMPPNPNWQAGQSIALRVQASPNGPWTLQPLAAPTQPAPLSPMALGPQASISRVGNLLFRPPGMPDVTALFRPGVMDALLGALPRTDLQAQWTAMRLSMATITPDALTLAVMAAMGSEALMARGKLPLPTDPKQLLHKLLAALGQTDQDSEESVTTSRHIQGAIDDIESAQVHATQAQARQEMMFTLVLPFKDAEPVELAFKRKPGAEGQLALLTVDVHSLSRDYGELWLKTELHGQSEVALVMWATEADVAEQARQRSPALGLELQGAGLVMRSFQAIHGARPVQAAEGAPSGRGMILDIQA